MIVRADQLGLVKCLCCGKVARKEDRPSRCPRCGSSLHSRKPDSVMLTWWLLLCASVMLIPANMYPVMTVVSFGTQYTETILSGILHMINDELYLIAFLIFVASIVVPAFKIIGIATVCAAAQFKWRINPWQARAMFNFIQFIGRWSMLDLFMISILMGLVDMGSIALVDTGPAATAFSGVVVLTMMAAITFDQRLIWDLRVRQPLRKAG